MTIVQISAERERNGYHDSDFYISVVDLETGKFDTHEVGSTRYGGGCRYDGILTPAELNAEQHAAFIGALWGHAVAMAESIEVHRVERPGPLFGEWIPLPGTRVELKEGVNNRAKVETACTKCLASGHWVNPRNENDKRKCFGCNGTGKRLGHAKGAGMIKIPAGTVGTVVDAGERRSQYGTFSYGATAKVRGDDGSTFNANTRALRLEERADMRNARKAAVDMVAGWINWTCHITGRTGKSPA